MELEELRAKMAQTESSNADAQRKVLSAESEFEKDKALLE